MFSHSLQLSLFSDYSRLTTIFWLSLQHFYRANSLISVMKRPRDRNVCLSNAFIAPPIFSRTKFRWIRCCFGSIRIPICPMKATDWRKGRRRCKIIKTFLHSLFAFLNVHMHTKNETDQNTGNNLEVTTFNFRSHASRSRDMKKKPTQLICLKEIENHSKHYNWLLRQCIVQNGSDYDNYVVLCASK